MYTETQPITQPPSAPPVNGAVKVAGLVLAVVAACGLGLLIFKGIQTRLHAETALQSEARAGSAPMVSVIHPKSGAPTSELVLPGSAEAFTETPVYARTNGYLKRWYFDIGAHVRTGQLLAEIETPEVDQQLSQARAELNTARPTSNCRAPPRTAGSSCSRPTPFRARRPTRSWRPARKQATLDAAAPTSSGSKRRSRSRKSMPRSTALSPRATPISAL